MGKKMDAIQKNKEFFEKYFNEDLKAIETELKKSSEYSAIIDREISKLSAPALSANKGGQHYLIEHITNAVQLQTQRQGLRRDRFNIKKSILDYSSKFLDAETGSDAADMTDLLNKLIEADKQKSKKEDVVEDLEDLDNDIDSILGEN